MFVIGLWSEIVYLTLSPGNRRTKPNISSRVESGSSTIFVLCFRKPAYLG